MKVQLIRDIKSYLDKRNIVRHDLTIENAVNDFLKNFNVDEAVHRIGCDDRAIHRIFESVLEEVFY